MPNKQGRVHQNKGDHLLEHPAHPDPVQVPPSQVGEQPDSPTVPSEGGQEAALRPAALLPAPALPGPGNQMRELDLPASVEVLPIEPHLLSPAVLEGQGGAQDRGGAEGGDRQHEEGADLRQPHQLQTDRTDEPRGVPVLQ